MYAIMKRTLIQHLQTLEHYFFCLSLSIIHWNEIQMRQIESLNQGIGCLRLTIEAFASISAPFPSVIEDDLYSQIVTLEDMLLLFQRRCSHLLNDAACQHLEQMIQSLHDIHNDLEAYHQQSQGA